MQQQQIIQETSPRNNSLRRRQDEQENNLPARDPSPRRNTNAVPEEQDDSVGADAPQVKEIDQKPGPSASQVGFNNNGRSGINPAAPFGRDLNKGRPDSKVLQQVAPTSGLRP